MTIEEIRQLALHSVKNTAPANFTVDTVNEALRDGIRGLASSINEFNRNKYDIFDIVVKAAEEVVPNKVIAGMGVFANIQQVPQGQKVVFKRGSLGRNRAKKFLTQVAPSGVYETFRLDKSTFTLDTHAVGGGVTMDFERWLDGAEDLGELMEVITEGQVDAIYGEVQRALIAAADAAGRPDANKVSVSAFDGKKMFDLITVVKAYAGGAVIFAPPEFIGAMGPDAIVPVSANYQGIYHPDDIDAIHRTGYVNLFRGTPIVQIPQSFLDESNVKTWINPQFAYVLPTGKEKVVNIVLEGETQIYDRQNRDNSTEIMSYRKLGVGILTHHNWGIYQNTGIADTSEFPYGI